MRSAKWKTVLHLAIFAVSVLFFDNSVTAAEAQKGGTVRLRLGAYPAQLSPFNYSDAYNNAALAVTYERLIDKTGFMPQLSRRLTKQNNTITIELESKATFANGQVLNANDVTHSIDQHIKREYFLAGEILSFTATSATTVEVKIGAAAGESVEQRLGQMRVLNAQAQAELAHGVFYGTGPYVITDVEPNTRLLLKRNLNWWKNSDPTWKTRFNFDVVLLEVVANNLARQAFMQEYIDYLEVSPAEVEGFKAEATKRFGNKVWVAEQKNQAPLVPGFNFIALNQKNADLAKPAIRKALSFLVDRSLAQREVLAGPFSSTTPWKPAELKPAALDLVQAKQLLETAELKQEEPLRLIAPAAANAAPLLKSFLNNAAQAGLNVKIEWLPWQVLTEKAKARDYDLLYLGVTKDTAENYLGMWHSKGSANFANWQSPVVDGLLEELNKGVSNERAQQIRAQVAQIVANEFCVIFLDSHHDPISYMALRAWIQTTGERSVLDWSAWHHLQEMMLE